ncbi:MAG: hypothetical protein AB1649_20050 [Chloroflexota bacterium]
MKHIPDEKQVEDLLTNFSPNVSKRLDRRLANAPWTQRAMVRRRLLNTTVFAILTAALVIAATPQGRAFAQNILRYFVRTEGDTHTIPTLVPIIAVASPDAASPAAPNPILETHLPFEDVCGSMIRPQCSLEEIRSMVTFPVKALAVTPDQVAFIGATGGPEEVTLVYRGEGLNGTLTLSEKPATVGTEPWPVAASTTVETVFVGDAMGEYVQGGWFSVGVDDSLAWSPDDFVQTLRWEADGILYTMVFHAAKMSTGILLDKPSMLDLAADLTAETMTMLEPTPSMSIQEISQRAGFPVIEPNWLPKGYAFLDAIYASDYHTACLFYTSTRGGNAPLLAIAEWAGNVSSTFDEITTKMVDVYGQQVTIPITTELLPVGGSDSGQAVLISNGVSADLLCPYKDFHANQALYWWSNGKSFVIFGLVDQYQGGVFISRLEMQRLAESLTGVATIPADRIDRERLRSVEEAEAIAGFDVKAPTQMVAGLQFDHAVVVDFDQLREVRLIYTVGAPTRPGIGYGFFITQGTGAIRTMEEVYGWGDYEYVSLNGLPALYRLACWDVTGGGTECYQEMSWDENGVGYDILAYLPGALERDEFFAIAQGMTLESVTK